MGNFEVELWREYLWPAPPEADDGSDDLFARMSGMGE